MIVARGLGTSVKLEYLPSIRTVGGDRGEDVPRAAPPSPRGAALSPPGPLPAAPAAAQGLTRALTGGAARVGSPAQLPTPHGASTPSSVGTPTVTTPLATVAHAAPPSGLTLPPRALPLTGTDVAPSRTQSSEPRSGGGGRGSAVRFEALDGASGPLRYNGSSFGGSPKA